MDTFVSILQCLHCKTFEEVPALPEPQFTFLLDKVVAPHDDKAHSGALRLYRIEKAHWDSPSTRAEVIGRMNEENGLTGFDAQYYTTRDTFREDAHKCFKRHNSNPNCSEYKSDRYLLTPDTAAERKAAGLPKYHGPKVFLCEYCPVHSGWRSAQYKKNGLDA